jgi:ammonium transporter Rh
LIWQSIIIILYGIFLEYDFDNFGAKSSQAELDRGYPMYQDVHVMIFVGFGFLMTFAAKYSFSAVGLNFFTSALVLQWAILNQPFWETVIGGKVFKKIGLSVPKLLDADFNAASMMISFGAVLGKVTPTQLIWIVLIGCTLNGLNFAIGYKHLETADIGGSIFIHIFGAYFGLATSWSLGWFNKLASASGVAAAVEQLQANPRPNER